MHGLPATGNWSPLPGKCLRNASHCQAGGAQPQSCFVARRAPCASASNFAHTTLGWMSGSRRACAEKPQSAPAITRSRPDEADDALRDQLRVLHQIRRVGDDAGDNRLALRQPHRLPDVVLVLVTRVGRLERVGASVDLEQMSTMSLSGRSWIRGPMSILQQCESARGPAEYRRSPG